MKYFNKIKNLVLMTGILVFPFLVFGADQGTPGVVKPSKNLETLGNKAGYQTAGGSSLLSSNVGYVIGVFLSIMGTIFVIMMVYAGWTWFTAMGDEKKVSKAKDIIWRAIIGLIITLSSWAIWAFVSSKIVG